jgi:hypothetical protein
MLQHPQVFGSLASDTLARRDGAKNRKLDLAAQYLSLSPVSYSEHGCTGTRRYSLDMVPLP